MSVKYLHVTADKEYTIKELVDIEFKNRKQNHLVYLRSSGGFYTVGELLDLGINHREESNNMSDNDQNIINISDLLDSSISLLNAKNQLYSGKVDNIGITGLLGIAVRLIDKAVRCYSLSLLGKENDIDEPIEDTLKDILCYAIIGLLVRKGKWSKNIRLER